MATAQHIVPLCRIEQLQQREKKQKQETAGYSPGIRVEDIPSIPTPAQCESLTSLWLVLIPQLSDVLRFIFWTKTTSKEVFGFMFLKKGNIFPAGEVAGLWWSFVIVGYTANAFGKTGNPFFFFFFPNKWRALSLLRYLT